MSILQRIWGSSKVSPKTERDDIPLEKDPVGEFLDKKKREVDPTEDNMKEATPAAGAPTKHADMLIDANGESTADMEAVEAAPAAESRLDGPVPTGVKAKTEAAGSQTDAKSGTPTVLSTGDREATDDEQGDAEASAVLAAARLATGSPAREDQKAASPLPASGSLDEEEIESALEVFRSEHKEVEIPDSLSNELGDMNVYSLLEETKRIAQITKKTPKLRRK